jgi:hypothetical protein
MLHNKEGLFVYPRGIRGFGASRNLTATTTLAVSPRVEAAKAHSHLNCVIEQRSNFST